MNTSKLSVVLSLTIASLTLVACNVQEPESSRSPSAQDAVAASSTAVVVDPPAQTAKVDPATVESLEAGWSVMAPRLVSQVDAYSKIEPKAFRLFMHPDQGKAAVVEFDTAGLDSITISPYIFDFNGDKSCESNKEAGVVDVLWSIDGDASNTIRVDRNYSELVPIDLTNSKRLKIVVNEGNGAPWCDWAGIGFIAPKP